MEEEPLTDGKIAILLFGKIRLLLHFTEEMSIILLVNENIEEFKTSLINGIGILFIATSSKPVLLIISKLHL